MAAGFVRSRRGQQGASLITAMFVSFVMMGLVALMFSQVIHTNESTGRDRQKMTVFHVAEAGVDQAISQLASNPAYAGTGGTAVPVTANGATIGSFTTTVIDPGPGITSDRVIRSTGVLSSGTQQRVVKATVRLAPLGGFDFAIFSAATLAVSNNLTVVGSTYSAQAATLQNNTTVTGDVTSPANITTANNSTINGSVWSGGSIVISTGTTITGNVLATGSVTIQSNAKVTGDVRAASITNNGTIQGQSVLASQPSPATRTLPAFTYDPANYPAPLGPPVNTTSTGFQLCWQSGAGCPLGVSRTAMRGVYYISDGGTVTGPSQRTTLAGDLYIITNGRVVIDRDFNTATSDTYRLVVISTSTSVSPAAVTWSNNVSLPPNIQTFIYTPGKVTFDNLKSFSGIVYGGQVQTDQNFTVAYEPALRDVVKGFSWDLSSSGLYEIKPLSWEECGTAAC
ncbi:MAG TPA: polymer-forming cytoskeletal protein [Actinomycetota bacterium]|nr:polymer-forming cytoskeletal protein [Actinomycetota bacterium]